MDSLMEKMIEYYKKEGIDYPKTKNGEPNMIYKQNRDTYNKMRDECVICSEKMKGVAELECGHKMCVQCCIIHFRKNDRCPFCRKMIAYHKKITDEEIENIIEIEMLEDYYYEKYHKDMDLYKFLKLKGLNKNKIEEVIDAFSDRCVEMCRIIKDYPMNRRISSMHRRRIVMTPVSPLF